MRRSNIAAQIIFGIACGIFALASTWSATASAAPEDEYGPRLLLVLSAIDVVPTADQLRAAGAGVEGEVLAKIAVDRRVASYTRTRAASCLSLFGAEAAGRSLRAILDDRTLEDREVKIQAIAALSVVEGARALEKISPVLADRDPELRAAAVRAIARMPGERARVLLAARLEVGAGEADLRVRALIERKLAGR